jgi:hypothetical protein
MSDYPKFKKAERASHFVADAYVQTYRIILERSFFLLYFLDAHIFVFSLNYKFIKIADNNLK